MTRAVASLSAHILTGQMLIGLMALPKIGSKKLSDKYKENDMRFGFTLDGYEILAIKNFVKPVPILAKAWSRFESNHYKKHIRYQVSDVMLHVRLPWLYHTDLWIQDHCRMCGSMVGTPMELSRKTFKDI